MATFSTVPLDEGQRLVMPPRRAAQEQYRQYVRALSPEEAGQLELGPDDKSITERAAEGGGPGRRRDSAHPAAGHDDRVLGDRRAAQDTGEVPSEACRWRGTGTESELSSRGPP